MSVDLPASRVDRDAALGDDSAKEGDGGAAELALRGLSVQLVVPSVSSTIRTCTGCSESSRRMSSQYTCTNHPSIGAPEPGGPTAGRARPVDKVSRPIIECMTRISNDDIP